MPRLQQSAPRSVVALSVLFRCPIRSFTALSTRARPRLLPPNLRDSARSCTRLRRLGDLNYRVDLSIVDKRERESHAEHWREVTAMAKGGRFVELMRADQLMREQKAVRAIQATRRRPAFLETSGLRKHLGTDFGT